MKVDIVCPLYQADKYIDGFIERLKGQQGIEIGNVIFPLTNTGDLTYVKEAIDAAGFEFFLVDRHEFSHSLTREKAVREYCFSPVVVMLSQDVVLEQKDAIFRLASAIQDDVLYAYGRQVVKKKTIEYYIRKKNYGEESLIVSQQDIEELQLKAFFASDAFSAYQREKFIELGGYDGKHMMMSEDMYYAKKVLENGYRKAYVADAVVVHSHKLTLKQLYNRYYATGVWFAEHPEFNNYHATDSGLKLAFYVLGQALKDFNVPVLFRWLPDMAARYFGMRKGKKAKGRS